MTTQHVSFERLNDLIDRSLSPLAAGEVESHIATCAACRGELEQLRVLLERAGALSRSIDPPAGAWSAIHQRVTSNPNRVSRGRWPAVSSWTLRAAAAILLVAGTSTLTLLAIRWREPTTGASPPVAVERGVTTNANLRAVDQSYADVVDELTTTLRAQRGVLAPETVASLERTLRIIDDAIAEARAALAADPGNSAVLDALTANYEQKVELLRRASELPART